MFFSRRGYFCYSSGYENVNLNSENSRKFGKFAMFSPKDTVFLHKLIFLNVSQVGKN